ncbi:hypothetical protein CYMTET_33433, partial [Cymbomonas tetramitiformis]
LDEWRELHISEQVQEERMWVGPTLAQIRSNIKSPPKHWWNLSRIMIPQAPPCRGEVKTITVVVENKHRLDQWELAAFRSTPNRWLNAFKVCWVAPLPPIVGKGIGQLIEVNVPPGAPEVPYTA